MKISIIKQLLRAALVFALGTASLAAAQEQTWKINVKNADLQEFVSQVATITGKTFVVDPRVKGNVTVISSEPMNRNAVYALFLSVLRVHNFIAMPSGDVIRITPNAQGKQTPGPDGKLTDIAPEELVTRVIAAQNVDSAELVKILRPLIPQYGHIAAVAQPNIVIISDHADNIVRLMEIIEEIDVADEDEVVIVDLEHAWVGTVVAMLEQVAPDSIGKSVAGPQRIQVVANERNNTLVLRGKQRPVAEVLKLISKLDRPATSSGSTRVFYLKHGDSTKIAEILSSIIGDKAETEGGQATTIQPDESLNAIVVRADRGKMTEIADILKMLDVRRSQVLIEAAIVEVSMTNTRTIGVDTFAVDQTGSATPLLVSPLTGAIQSLIAGASGEDGGIDLLTGAAGLSDPTLGVAKIDTSGVSFSVVLQALSTNQNANLLSTPSILTLDNQEAKIVVGNEVPFRTGSFSTTGDGSNNPFTTIQREDVGLQLTVTPHVHDGHNVRLEVDQEITNVVPTPIGDSSFSDVVTSKRTINTVVLAENQQTLVLGGLIQDDITEGERRVPLLGSIPGVGWLFRSKSNENTRRNLLIFLRPTVVNTVESADQETERKYQDVWKVDILIPGADKPGSPSDMFDGRQ
ncbi:MAG: type II secretion system secretin GspD [Pseudomonadales bacterium]|nr:type II secretion system secretin GspD [Pseudomonadales bacterium]